MNDCMIIILYISIQGHETEANLIIRMITKKNDLSDIVKKFKLIQYLLMLFLIKKKKRR